MEEITGGGGGGGSSDISASTPLITSYLSSKLGSKRGKLPGPPVERIAQYGGVMGVVCWKAHTGRCVTGDMKFDVMG